MPAQPDMFTAEDDPDPPIANAIDEPCSPPALPSLAIPCGFQNRNNQPCQRLAYDVVSIDGVDLIHRGHQLLKCVPGVGETNIRGPIPIVHFSRHN